MLDLPHEPRAGEFDDVPGYIHLHDMPCCGCQKQTGDPETRVVREIAPTRAMGSSLYGATRREVDTPQTPCGWNQM